MFPAAVLKVPAIRPLQPLRGPLVLILSSARLIGYTEVTETRLSGLVTRSRFKRSDYDLQATTCATDQPIQSSLRAGTRLYPSYVTLEHNAEQSCTIGSRCYTA